MTTTTETGFYTLDGRNTETRCAQCALEGTNAGLMLAGMAPAETMAEAAAVVQMVLVLGGNPDADTFLTYSEHGTCSVCGKSG